MSYLEFRSSDASYTLTIRSTANLIELPREDMKGYANSPQTAYGKAFAREVNGGPLDLENAFRVQASMRTQTLEGEGYVVYIVYPDIGDEAVIHQFDEYQGIVNPPEKEGERVQVFELSW